MYSNIFAESKKTDNLSSSYTERDFTSAPLTQNHRHPMQV